MKVFKRKGQTMCFRPPSVDQGNVKCPKCGAEVSALASECPNCGAKAAPGVPPVPGMPPVPPVPGAPGAPKAPGVPKAPGQK